MKVVGLKFDGVGLLMTRVEPKVLFIARHAFYNYAVSMAEDLGSRSHQEHVRAFRQTNHCRR